MATNRATNIVVVDSHLDLAYNSLSMKRDLLLDIEKMRSLENGRTSHKTPTVSFPEMLRGNVRIAFATLWVNPCKYSTIEEKPCYTTQEEAHVQALEQLTYYEQLERQGILSIIKTRGDLGSFLASDSRRIGVVLLMEGADPIREPSEVREWFRRGVRIVGPAWKGTHYAGGTGVPGPLTPDGRKLVEEMNSAGMMLDGSHLSEESYFDALDRFKGQFIVSHSNSRKFCPTDRQLSDEMISAAVKRGAVIGTVLFNAFLTSGWKEGEGKKDEVAFAHVVRNMKHVCEIAGDTLHAGIGSDLDGGFGMESTPKELDTIADVQNLGTEMIRSGFFHEEDVANILGQNWIRLLERALPI